MNGNGDGRMQNRENKAQNVITIFIALTLFLPMCLAEAPYKNLEDATIIYGENESNSYNWQLDFTNFPAPTKKTEFDSGTFDNITNVIDASKYKTFETGFINDNLALMVNNTPGSTGNVKLNEYSMPVVRTIAFKIRTFYNATIENAGAVTVRYYIDASNYHSFIFLPYKYGVLTRANYKVSGVTGNEYAYSPMTQHDINNNTLLIMCSWNNITGEIAYRVNNYVYSISTGAILSGNIDQLNIDFATNFEQKYRIDDIYRWNTIFNLSQLRRSIPPGLIVAYPPNNKDLGYNSQIHADDMTANMTIPLYDTWNKYGISGTIYYFSSTNTPAKNDPIDYTGFNFSSYLREQIANGHTIGTHALSDITTTRTNLLIELAKWNSLLGEYPPIWTDHGGIYQTLVMYGANASSDYYIDDILDSYGTWKWPNLRAAGMLMGWPNWTVGGTYSDNFISMFNKDAIYEHNGTENLIIESSGAYTVESWMMSGVTYIPGLPCSRGLVMDHNYISRYVYLVQGGTNFSWYWTTHFPELTLTSKTTDANLNADYHYYDDTGTWTTYPRYDWLLYNLTNYFDIYSVNGKEMLDRADMYSNIQTVFNTDEIEVTNGNGAALDNVTIYSNGLQYTGKALTSGTKHFMFINGTWSTGATIDSVAAGATTYAVEDAPISILENNTAKLGRIVYDTSSETIDVGVNWNGTVHLSIPGTWSSTKIQVYDVTNNTLVNWSEGSVEFIGVRDHEYLISELGTSFSYSISGRTVTFTDDSIGHNLTYLWDFDDGETSTDQNPSHTFDYGTYDVSLTVTDEYGATDTTIEQIFIESPADQINSLVPIVVAGMSVVVVIVALNSAAIVPLRRIFRRPW